MNANKACQRMQILDYCKTHGSITVREAAVELHMNSPTKRISELRGMGYPIREAWEERLNREGVKTRYKRYYIGEQ